jgi:hypothetical protein
MSIQFLQLDPELSGAYLSNTLGVFTNQTLMRLRGQYGLLDINARAWYPAHTVLALLRDLALTADGPFTLVSMGITQATRMPLPDSVHSIEQGLLQLCEVLYENWRNGTPGDLSVEVRGPGRVWLTVSNGQLPGDLIYGMVYGVAHRIGTQGAQIAIDRVVRGSTTVYDVRW